MNESHFADEKTETEMSNKLLLVTSTSGEAKF